MSFPQWLQPPKPDLTGSVRFSPSVTEKSQEKEEEAREKAEAAARKRARNRKYYEVDKANRQAKAREYYQRVVKAKR